MAFQFRKIKYPQDEVTNRETASEYDDYSSTMLWNQKETPKKKISDKENTATIKKLEKRTRNLKSKIALYDKQDKHYQADKLMDKVNKIYREAIGEKYY